MASKKGKKAAAVVSEETVVENGTAKHENGLTNGHTDKEETDKQGSSKGRGRPKKAESRPKVDSSTDFAGGAKIASPRQAAKNKAPPAEEQVSEGTGDVDDDSPPQNKKGKGRGRPAAKTDKTEKMETTDKVDKPAKAEKVVKADKVDTAEKADKTNKKEKVVEKKQKTVPESDGEVTSKTTKEAPAKAKGRPKKAC